MNNCLTLAYYNFIILVNTIIILIALRGSVGQWAVRLIRNLEVVGSSSVKGPYCFLEQETLPLWLVPGTDSSVISQSN